MKRKSFLSGILATTLVLGLFSGCGSSAEKTPEVKPANSSATTSEKAQGDTSTNDSAHTLVIYGWNDQFQERFNKYALPTLPKDLKVEWVITPGENNAYQNKLDQDLMAQDSNSMKLDMFVVEADYVLKYVDSPYSLDVINDIGLTADDTKNQYNYTKVVSTDKDGKLKAVTWEADPGLFAYRRSIAKAVLGTDNPDEVQGFIDTWPKFDEVAKKMNESSYKMMSGYDDSYRVFSNNMKAPWVDESGKIVIDDQLMKWVDQTKEYTDKGYNNKSALWDSRWNADQGPAGNVFGFFYAPWGINFTLLANSLATPVSEGGKLEVGNGIFGDYGVVKGPQSFNHGGTFIMAAKGTDNSDVIRDIMKIMTCDTATMKQMTFDFQDFTNNQEAMNEIAKSDFKSDFLSGQNHIALFAEVAPTIDMSNISKYDQGLTEEFQKAFRDYFDGNSTKEESLANFYVAAIEKYPNLKQ